MAKVYLSSTIADLEAERRVVTGWLVAAQHQVVHSYRPSSDTVRDGSLDDVDTCDLYVLILGHRYGFQPPEDNPDGLSITHLEFRRAGQSRKRRVALLRTSIPDERQSDMDDAQKWARVRAFRAEVAGTVRAGEFGDLRGLVQELSIGVQAESEKIQAEQANQAAAPMGAGLIVRLAPRPLFLAGRGDLLAEVDARLGGGAGLRVVALHGMAGAGKTSLALGYAHHHLAEVGIMWQFAAEDLAVLAAQFTELATELGVREGSGDPVVAVHGALAGSAAEWLLVFDNAPGPEEVEAFVPPTGNGRVLITSRNALWPPGQGLEVPVLDLEAAADFLAARTGDTDRRAAAALAEAMGGLPLALEQAAAYAQATGNTLGAYLALFHKRRADLLDRGRPAGYGGTVAATWALAFTQLEQSEPGAVGLLRLLAFCAPEAIPLRLLLQPRPGLAGQLNPQVAGVLVPLLDDELAAGDAVAALRRYSLARPAGDGLVSVHRLVQAVTADQMPAGLSGAWRQAAAAVIEAALPGDPQQPANWSVYASLLPHAQAALAADSAGMEHTANYLGYRGNYIAARELFGRIVKARGRAFGPQAPGTLISRNHLAFWTGEAGDAAGARGEFAALVPLMQQALRPEHQKTLITRGNLAQFTGKAGDAAGARDQYAALLPIFEKVSGPEDRETLTMRAGLARWTGEAGDAAAARDQYAALLPARERVLGPEAPRTLTTRASLARWTGEAGDAAGARDQVAALLPIRERVLGAEHPDTLAVRGDLAYWTGEAGDAAAARDQYAALLPIRERVLGAEHPDTLATRSNIALWTGQSGDARGALERFTALLPDRQRVLGPDHPDTLATSGNIAFWTGRSGDARGALERFTALLPDQERVLGPDHPDTLTIRHNIAFWTGQSGDARGALERFTALLPDQERVRGPDHPDTLATRSNIASWTGRSGDARGALERFTALLPDRQRVRGPDHPDTLITRHDIALWTGQSGDARGALERFTALLPDQERVLGPDHPGTRLTRERIGALSDRGAKRTVYQRVLSRYLKTARRSGGRPVP